MTSLARAGVLVIDKAAGPTSFDVVATVRKALGIRRVGHAGTLDPAAAGVLPVLVGQATKLMPYLADQDKEYVATVRLGVTTDTQDLSGRVVAERPVPAGLVRADVERAAAGFVGTIRQIPPMYSAVHHDGRRLYELAREGVEVERAAREVVVRAITVEDVSLPVLTLRIVCGKGTYVRTLAADLGEALGCGAAVGPLVRWRVGPFALRDAMPSDRLAAEPADRLWARVRPPLAALADWPVTRLAAALGRAFTNGQTVPATLDATVGEGRLVAVVDAGGELTGVGQVTEDRRVRPMRILNADRPGSRVLPA
ncbi:MAG: tRNA pseudouridine(55) synthase TruB [Candidatus Rokubacteria bacterium]|nr:tRNA pseudouridine(55) synthase TruB [Candidatus Rokubacteria bacterium]